MIDSTSSSDIKQLIAECGNEAMKKILDSHLPEKLTELAKALANYYQCCYCGIGTIDGDYAEDRACWPQGLPAKMKRGKRKEGQSEYLLFKALEKNGNPTVVIYGKNEIEKAINSKAYHENYGDFEFCSIIIFRERDESPHGYIQFLSAEKPIGEAVDFPFAEDILRLIFTIKLWYARKDEHSFREDFDFINFISQQTDDVDLILQKIMEYLSETFNAGIISYRIPLLVGSDRKPVFYLRKWYIRDDIQDKEHIREEHFTKRLLIGQDEMDGGKELSRNNHVFPIFTCNPEDIIKLTDEQLLKDKAVIIPIIRVHAEKNECINNLKADMLCEGNKEFASHFEKYLGVFNLRIFEVAENSEDNTVLRLATMAKHISSMLSTIVTEQENQSLRKFQVQLRSTSFARIGEFDEQCAKILCDSVGAEACAIYKYVRQQDKMILTATYPNDMRIYSSGNIIVEFHKDFGITLVNINNRFNPQKVRPDVDDSSYVVKYKNRQLNSLLLKPIIKKDGSKLGMILLLGKRQEGSEKLVSKTYWEQDRRYIEFMVDILGRIEESDSERLTFLQQLSHELRSPITQMVSGNELLIETYKRNKNELYRGKPITDYTIGALEDNVRQTMMFKQIIGDVQFIYSLSKGEVSYNLENVDIKECILDCIKLFEKVPDSILETPKRLSFNTQLRQLPVTLFVDRERIKQVFINLLKNAVQYADDHSIITIRYNYNDEIKSHEIDFINYGIGVDQSKGNRLFQLWERGGNAQRLRPSGTGMGLFIVQEIMKAHEGECCIKRYYNPTIFTVRIPLKK
jgi:signal transduction histidine kinase